ncbi:DNA excision repair ercc-8-like protein [Globisporangium polare]
MAATERAMPRRQRRSSAFAYVCDRSVGLGARRFCDELHAEEVRAMAPVGRNFIYNAGMKAWAMELDPVDDRYLLVGTANSNVMLFDLQMLDKSDASDVAPAYDTSNQLPPVCCARARSMTSSSNNNSITSRVNGSSPSALQYGISAVDWYPVDGGIFVTSSLDGHVKVWDSDVFRVVSEFALSSKVFCAKFSRIASAHSLVAAVTEKGEVRLCDMAIESSIHSLLGHSDEVWSLAWSLESEYQLSTGSRNGEIRMWDIRRSGSTACLLCLNHEGAAVAPGRSSVHTNVKRLPTMSLNAASKPASLKRRRIDATASVSSNTSASDNRLERERKRNAAARTPVVKRNDPHAAASVSFATAHSGGVNSLAYTPDGRYLLSSGTDQKLRLWNSKTGEHAFMNYQGVQNQVASRNIQMAVVQEADPWDSTLVFHPNGRLGELSAYQVFGDDGAPLMRYTAHYQQITACAYRKTRRELFTGGKDGIIMKWRPTPVALCPGVEGASGQDGDNALGQSFQAQLAVAGAAVGDVDAWSDDEDDEDGGAVDQGDIFIPPILRQYQDNDRH